MTPISEINAPETIEMLKHLHLKGALEMVKRICQRLNEIMVFATNTGLISHNPIAGIKIGLRQRLRMRLKIQFAGPIIGHSIWSNVEK